MGEICEKPVKTGEMGTEVPVPIFLTPFAGKMVKGYVKIN